MNKLQAILLARELRRRQTYAEKVFWDKVRNRKLFSLKFNRQYVVEYQLFDEPPSFFIVDFYCHQLKLIIEIDGPIHKFQKEYDKDREEILSVFGYKILRFENEEVIENWSSVKEKIKSYLK